MGILPARQTVPTRALVVDDDLQVRRLVARQLQQLGIERVESATDGVDAIRTVAAANPPFDVVVCDLNMPREDGLVFMRRLAGRDRPPAVVLMSGGDAVVLDAARRLALERKLDILGVVCKPCTVAMLAAVLARFNADPSPPASKEVSPHPQLDVVDLAESLRRELVEVWFQPQLDLTSHRILAVEALVRLRHDVHGLLLPGSFIATAEEHGLIVPLTTRVLEQAVTWCRAWQDAGLQLSVSVNLSAVGLHDLSYPDAVLDLCARRHIDPGRIVFELTESALAADSTTLLDILTRLRLKGFRLSIDDFGAGYASLEQLRALPFSELKVDRRFVQDAVHDARSRLVLSNSLDLATQLKLITVAEGVESEAELDLVTRLGCDVAQGYLIGKPMAASEVRAWIARRSPATTNEVRAARRSTAAAGLR